MASSDTASDRLRRKGDGYIVAAVEELPPGARKIVQVAGREIGVFNINGELYALRNVCPHKAGPLCLGRVRPLVVDAGVGGYDHQRENEILKCPWHLWEFDIKTGRAIHDENIRVKTYAVRQEDDDIVLYPDHSRDRG
jgi:3-phenylpropionate/trans-cinnamate dioxygenase ferredoxin subunit